MRCLKGIVLDKWVSGLVLIKLQATAHRFWIKSESKCRVRQAVLVAWDYVRNEPRNVFTEEDWNKMLGDRETEYGDFSFPSFGEVGEGEVIDFDADTGSLPTGVWWVEEGTEIGDGVDGDFSDPINDGTEAGVAEDHHNNH